MLKNSVSLTRLKVILPLLGLLLTACAPEPEVDNVVKINPSAFSSDNGSMLRKPMS